MTEDVKKLYDQLADKPLGTNGPVLHVRVQGRSRDISLDLLGVNSSSSDEAIRSAVGEFMELPPAQLRNTVIERHENGNLTMRPEAVFG